MACLISAHIIIAGLTHHPIIPHIGGLHGHGTGASATGAGASVGAIPGIGMHGARHGDGDPHTVGLGDPDGIPVGIGAGTDIISIG